MVRNNNEERIQRLEKHLRVENPVLADAVASFRNLDRIQRKLGLMDADHSLATLVSWWPVIAVLGTFSAGKSSFINQAIGKDLQRTGNQAVDDKFTVICFGSGEATAALPGLALDSDPRFPFYQISREIEKVADGEGRRVDSYLQLKTCESEALRGRIVIDSPGFDADQQRTSTLLIAEHIIDLSDLVLVFFDARHPEPGAMSDTLQHLVNETVNRHDSTKFLYILNQIDNSAREDNPEEVVAAWQRALAQHGLTAGRFYRIYSRDVALQIEDEQVRERMERKRDEDLADIEGRIRQVEVERAYRVIGVLEKSARHVRDVLVPTLESARRRWRRRTLWLSSACFLALGGLFFWLTISQGYWNGLVFLPFAQMQPAWQGGILAAGAVLLWFLHMKMRGMAGQSVLRKLKRDDSLGSDRDRVVRAFEHNLKAWWHTVASARPRNWNWRGRRQLDRILNDADGFVQALNDRYASPSGHDQAP